MRGGGGKARNLSRSPSGEGRWAGFKKQLSRGCWSRGLREVRSGALPGSPQVKDCLGKSAPRGLAAWSASAQ
eukprot:73486-Alexandrium_andersonii.AAC.1